MGLFGRGHRGTPHEAGDQLEAAYTDLIGRIAEVRRSLATVVANRQKVGDTDPDSDLGTQERQLGEELSALKERASQVRSARAEYDVASTSGTVTDSDPLAASDAALAQAQERIDTVASRRAAYAELRDLEPPEVGSPRQPGREGQ